MSLEKRTFKITKWHIDVEKRNQNSKYKVPEEAECYEIDIEDDVFNIESFYSLFLKEAASLQDLNSLGWKTMVTNGRIQIIAINNEDPEYKSYGDPYNNESITARYNKVQCPAGKSLVVYYKCFENAND